jgi:hypothetical protein
MAVLPLSLFTPSTPVSLLPFSSSANKVTPDKKLPPRTTPNTTETPERRERERKETADVYVRSVLYLTMPCQVMPKFMSCHAVNARCAMPQARAVRPPFSFSPRRNKHKHLTSQPISGLQDFYLFHTRSVWYKRPTKKIRVPAIIVLVSAMSGESENGDVRPRSGRKQKSREIDVVKIGDNREISPKRKCHGDVLR